MTIKKWHEVYSGSEEYNFFIGKDKKSGLVRSQYDFRSSTALAKEAGITKERAEEIIDKYLKLSIIIQSPNKEDHYGYWLRVAPHLGQNTNKTIAQTDQEDRVKKSKKP